MYSFTRCKHFVKNGQNFVHANKYQMYMLSLRKVISSQPLLIMKFLISGICCFCCLLLNAKDINKQKKGNENLLQHFKGPLLPANYGILNNGTLISQESLNTWLNDCRRMKSPVYFPAGKYLLPANFEYNFGNNDLSILGDGADKTILTTNNGAATNFAIPAKIDLTKPKPANDGIYQADIIAANLHSDYKNISAVVLDSYIQILNSEVNTVSLATVKKLGYVTELDTGAPDPGIDGLYVVAKHPSHDYGGGFAHMELGFTGNPLYIQGTVLQRKNGTWSRYYSSVAFISQGNFSVKKISFRNFRPYLFLPTSKEPQQDIKTSNRFIIEQCSFENTARILATMAYGGIMQSPDWYKASSYYSINWNMRFKKFIIRDCEFSYIHESIVWGAPPCFSYDINNNNIHDCYTILNCFYLFPQYNTSLPMSNHTTFSICNNIFLRVRALNPGSENTVQLIRTMNTGSIKNNSFIDCTGIHLYLNGSTKVDGNIIKTFMADIPEKQVRPPVILVKIVKDELISVSNNVISMGMMGNLIANESNASFSISNNKLIGPGTRYISSLTDSNTNLDIYRTYIITDIKVFKKLAGNDTYDHSIKPSDNVYYNKRNSRWEKLKVIPFMYLYSEADNINQYQQDIKFTGNEIEATYLTRIQKKIPTKFNSVSFEKNIIQHCIGLNTGDDNTVIQEYKFNRNTIKNGSLNMESRGNISTTIKKLEITGNTFFADFTTSSSFTASDKLIFQKNSFVRNAAFDFGSSASYHSFGLAEIAAPVYQLSLKGYPGQQLIIQDNNFIADMTKGNILNITDPDNVSITSNTFDLTMPAWQSKYTDTRTAISFNATKTVTSIGIEKNRFIAETGKENHLVSFDDSHSIITEFTNAGNIITSDTAAVSETITAKNKTFINYYKGKNKYPDKENILTVNNRLRKK